MVCSSGPYHEIFQKLKWHIEEFKNWYVDFYNGIMNKKGCGFSALDERTQWQITSSQLCAILDLLGTVH